MSAIEVGYSALFGMENLKIDKIVDKFEPLLFRSLLHMTLLILKVAWLEN